jgi:FKBP-type peptidyl-prolyl cis-trans isomerase FklB
MKKYLALAISSALLTACQQSEDSNASSGNYTPAGTPRSISEKVGYSLGVDVASYLKEGQVGMDEGHFVQGFLDAWQAKDLAMTPEERNKALTEAQQAAIAMQEEKYKEVLARNMASSKAFLTEAAKGEGVQTTSSDLLYKEMAAGEGDSPGAQDIVQVHYTGTLPDGTVFDSSVERGEPVEFPLDQVIPGWTEGVQLMKKGGKMRIWLPPELAYGEQGSPPAIGPNQALMFDIELLDIRQNKPAEEE